MPVQGWRQLVQIWSSMPLINLISPCNAHVSNFLLPGLETKVASNFAAAVPNSKVIFQMHEDMVKGCEAKRVKRANELAGPNGLLPLAHQNRAITESFGNLEIHGPKHFCDLCHNMPRHENSDHLMSFQKEFLTLSISVICAGGCLGRTFTRLTRVSLVTRV